MRSILPSIYLSTGILHACSAIPIPYRYSGQDNVVIIGLLTCIGIGLFMLGVCIFCKKKSGKFKKFKDGDIIQEVISTEYPILKALNALDSSVPCAVVPSSPNNLSTDNLLDKIETYQLAVDHRHESYCTRRSDPLSSTYDEFDPNDDPDDERSEQRSTAVTATVEQTASADEPTLLFSDSAFDDTTITVSDKCNLGQDGGAAPVSVPPLPLSSGEDEDEDEECPATTGVRSDAEDEDERRPLVSDESIEEAVATTTVTTTITGTGTTMAHSAEDAISIEEALRALDIAIEGEEEEEEEEDENEDGDDGDKIDPRGGVVKEAKEEVESEKEEEELVESQATPLPEGVGDVCSSSHSLYSEPPSRHDEEEQEAAALRRAEIEQQAAELVDDVLYKCEYMLQMMDANGSTLSPLEAGEFSPRSSRGPATVFDGWGMGLDLEDNVNFAPIDMADDRDEDWWKDSLEPFGAGGDEMEWNRAGHDPFQDDHTFDLLRQQLTQLLPQANDFAAGNSKANTDDLTTVSPKATDSGNDTNASSSEDNEIIINYNRSLSPILEENEDECSLPASTSVAHCSNLLESTILSTEGPVVCEATESVPALLACRRSSLTASNDTLFNLEDVLEDRCYTPLDDATSPFPVASPRSVHVDSASSLLANATNCGLDKLYAFQTRLLATSMASASSTSPTLPFTTTTDTNTISSDDDDDDDENDDDDQDCGNDHHLFEHLHHHVLLSSLRLQDLDTGDIMESPPPPPPPPPAAARTRTVHSLTIGGGEAKQ